MTVINAKSVCGGIAIGRIRFIRHNEEEVKRVKIQDTEAEKARFEKAKKSTLKQLSGLYDKALREVGETNAAIFEIHQMMVEDEDYNDAVNSIIDTQEVNAEYAVAVTADNFANMFAAMDDEYMNARASDVKDISNRLIRNLSGEEEAAADEGKYIICADDLVPSETVQLDKNSVLAFVTRHGSSNSHTAILARTMAVPALIGATDLTPESDGKLAAVDGAAGRMYIDPDEAALSELRARQEDEQRRKALLRELKGKESITLDGRKIKIYANIGGLGDIGSVLLNDAEGIGLFRSEFLYLEREDYPDEAVQFMAYKKILESMGGKKVIVRTLDIGADKQIDYFRLDKEENPALGFRAIRICLTNPEIFRTQLRALYRASAFGDLSIMFPMITSLKEVREIKAIAESVRTELKNEGIEYSDDVELGIMIETPAAAVISDILAPEVDFFSVGTNDLTQYTLACDRQNPKLDPFCDTHHEAILRLIGMAADAAHKNGKWIGICGELGADTALTEHWLRMGIDELSVSPSLVLDVREKVRSLDLNRN
ncbi:MAG: phosphoenolpyruvate--protein phosphotransferase [Huintestinicola sp.]